MSITVYAYHPVHGAYTGRTDADASPLEPGVFLDPAYTTRNKPPLYGKGEVPVYDGSTWIVIPDHRGEVWYDTENLPVLVATPGNPEDAGLIREPLPTPEPAPPTEPAFPKPPERISLYKTDIYSRMSDEELDAFDEAMGAADTRTRLMWRDCLQVEIDSPFFTVLLDRLEAGFGKERAAQILSLKP